MNDDKPEYFPGIDCMCCAYGKGECACGADWTDPEVYSLRDRLAAAERILGCKVEDHPASAKPAVNSTMVGVWQIPDFPYFQCGHVDKFFDDNAAKIKGYADNYRFKLTHVVYGQDGEDFIRIRDEMVDEQFRAKQEFKIHWNNIAFSMLESIVDPRGHVSNV
jgi:hypothetical protein